VLLLNAFHIFIVEIHSCLLHSLISDTVVCKVYGQNGNMMTCVIITDSMEQSPWWWWWYKSCDSSVGIALGYGLDYQGSRVWLLAGAGNFFHHHVQNGSGAHPVSCPMGTRGSFPGGKAARAWRWPLTSIKCRGQRMSGAIPPLPQYAFMAWCWVKEAQGPVTYILFC
jgi:hypothetical protein